MIVAQSREFDSDVAELREIRRHLRSILEPHLRARRARGQLNELELAVNEAASNVIFHAYGGQAGRKLRLETELSADRVVVRLHHRGVSFQPGAVPTPKLDGSLERGYGLFIMGRTVDEIRYSADEQGENCIQLTKLLDTFAGNAKDGRDE